MAEHAADQVGELARAGDRRILALTDDGAGNGARAALLAEAEQNVGDVGFIKLIDDIGGADAFAGHAHVERTVAHEGEAALRLVELHGGHAEIEDDRVGGHETGLLRDLGQPRKRRRLEVKAVGIGFGEIGGEFGGQRIAVQGEEKTFGAGEHIPRIAASAECAVYVTLAIFWGERLTYSRYQHRSMTSRSACGVRGLSLAATRHHSRTPSLRPSANGRFPAPSSLRCDRARSRASVRNSS